MIKPPSSRLTPVKVQIIEIEWLNKNIRALYQYLAQIQDETMFDNELIKMLLVKQKYQWQIAFKVLLPYIVYMFSVMYYFTYILVDYESAKDT